MVLAAGSPDICLINLLSRVQIQLPPRYTFPDVQSYSANRVEEEYHLVGGGGFFENLIPSNYVHLNLLHKVITSFVPSSEDCVVVAIYGEVGRVAWCTQNCKNWKSLEFNVNGPFEDLRFYKNKLYIVSCNGDLLEVENICPNPKVTIIAPPPTNQRYLAECSNGSLIMIGRYIDDDELTSGLQSL